MSRRFGSADERISEGRAGDATIGTRSNPLRHHAMVQMCVLYPLLSRSLLAVACFRARCLVSHPYFRLSPRRSYSHAPVALSLVVVVNDTHALGINV